MGKLWTATLILVSALTAIPAPSTAASWPGDADWIPIAGVKSDPVLDPYGDVSGGQEAYDIVGSGGDPAGYYFDDFVTLYFRVRLAGSPADVQTQKWLSFALFVLMDNDGDFSDGSYDYFIRLNGTSDSVELGQNQVKIFSGSWCDDDGDFLASGYPAPADFSGNARVVPAPSTFGVSDPSSGTDSFLDIQVPLDDWSSLTGSTSLDNVQIVLGTSARPDLINKDTADLECGESWGSIPVSTEPTSWGRLKAMYRD